MKAEVKNNRKIKTVRDLRNWVDRLDIRCTNWSDPKIDEDFKNENPENEDVIGDQFILAALYRAIFYPQDGTESTMKLREALLEEAQACREAHIQFSKRFNKIVT